MPSSQLWTSGKPHFTQINIHFYQKKKPQTFHENIFSKEQFPFPSFVTLKCMPNVSKSQCFILFNWKAEWL